MTPHRIGHLRDLPADDYRPVLFMLPVALADELDEHIETGGLAATADARDDIAAKALRAYLDQQRRDGTAASGGDRA